MQLTYRGFQYNVESSASETVESDMVGLYRGVPHSIPAMKQGVTRQPHKLSYRGVQY